MEFYPLQFVLFFRPACTLEEAEPETLFLAENHRLRPGAADIYSVCLSLDHRKKKKTQLQSSALESSPKIKSLSVISLKKVR